LARDGGKSLDLKGFAESFGEAFDARGCARAFWAAFDLAGVGRSFWAGFGNGIVFVRTQIRCASAVIHLERRQDGLLLGQEQNNLGNVPASLGEHESCIEQLEGAVAAYREALKEQTREPAPLDWARTQNNPGNALLRLGARDSGTARLEEAVAAFDAALEVFVAAKADYYVEVAQQNRPRAEVRPLLLSSRTPRRTLSGNEAGPEDRDADHTHQKCGLGRRLGCDAGSACVSPEC
jgi:tetratricopeptide (TPR) repeat protein